MSKELLAQHDDSWGKGYREAHRDLAAMLKQVGDGFVRDLVDGPMEYGERERMTVAAYLAYDWANVVLERVKLLDESE